jgi:ABC-type phosphate transport system substrate-binding protein
MLRRIFLCLFIAGLTLPAARTSAQQPATPAFRVIVSSKLAVSSISKKELAKIFLKKSTTWPGGGKALPVDQAASSAVREAFSRAVHGKSAKAVKNWWNQQIYSGAGVPPPELAGDAKVVAYVLANPGAVGYVSGDAAIGDAKVLTITD